MTGDDPRGAVPREALLQRRDVTRGVQGRNQRGRGTREDMWGRDQDVTGAAEGRDALLRCRRWAQE